MKTVFENFDLHQPDATQPKYERLKEHFLAALADGRLKPGQALPPETSMAEALRVARSTVRQALSELQRSGLLCRVQGKGTFIKEDARQRLNRGLAVYALVVPEVRAGFYPELLHGFDQAAHEVQHQVIVCNSDNDLDKQGNIILRLLDKEVAGVAIVPTTTPATPAYQVRQLHKHNIPVVFCHRAVEGVEAPTIAIPYWQVGHLAGSTLAEHGHRRVAFFGSHRAESGLAYLAGARQALRDAGGDLVEQFVMEGRAVSPSAAIDEDRLLEQLKRTFDGAKRPTAIFASFDSLAESIFLLLGRLGLRVPEDVSLIGVGGARRERAILRQLTSVAIDEAQTARRAVELLEAMRNGTRAIDNDEQIVLPLSVTNGQTVGPAKNA